MVRDTEPREPGTSAKCRTEAINGPGFLTATTYVQCGADPCVVNGTGDTHRVQLRNDSTRPYHVDLRARCLTDGIAFGEDGRLVDTWTETGIYVPASRKSKLGVVRSGRGAGSDRILYAVRAHDDELIEVAVSWSCIPNFGAGDFEPPLLIQVDAKPAKQP
jgi:hypothetical protein